jgi:hypothetical protein
MSNVNDGRRIPAPDLQEDDKRLLEFSFKYLDSTNEKFSPQECSVEFFRALIEAIQAYSHWTVERFTDQNNKDHRHIIVFEETTEPDGFSTLEEDQLAYHDAWQFGLSKTEVWRVHGILIDNVFYVVWLDPDHKLD